MLHNARLISTIGLPASVLVTMLIYASMDKIMIGLLGYRAFAVTLRPDLGHRSWSACGKIAGGA